jgi:hypothetical protein
MLSLIQLKFKKIILKKFLTFNTFLHVLLTCYTFLVLLAGIQLIVLLLDYKCLNNLL